MELKNALWGFRQAERKAKVHNSKTCSFINMDNYAKEKVSSFQLYRKYSRKDVHAIFADGTRYAEGGGVWGRAGVVSPKNGNNVFVLFCLVKNGTRKPEAQYVEPAGKFHWVSQPSMDPHNPKLMRIMDAGRGESTVLLFAKPSPGPLYTYLGKLLYVSHDEGSSKPVLVEWQIAPWPLPRAEADSFITRQFR